MENKTCLVCNKNTFEKIYSNTLLKCNNCGFITANMTISSEELKKTYTENYFKGEEYVDYIRDKEILQSNFQIRLKNILKRKEVKEISNALEIGCAYGFFAEVLHKNFSNIKYVGYDVVPEAIDYGKNILHQNVVCENYLNSKTEEKYSDVFMWDVIEHLTTPDIFIEKISKETKSGSRLYITTGDIDRIVPKFQKARWRMIHPPSHLHYFSRKTLGLLLEKNGFKIVTVSYPSISRSIHLIFFSLFMLRKKPSTLTKKIYNTIPKSWSIPINTFDIMFVTAEKK